MRIPEQNTDVTVTAAKEQPPLVMNLKGNITLKITSLKT